MAKHRIFNADRFLDKFQGREPLLQAYCRLWPRRLQLKVANLDVPTFKEWLVNGEGDARDELMEGLYRCYDISTERGHEDLFAACADFEFDPDPQHALPVECLALKVRTEKEDAFNLAYDRNAMFQAERFTVRRGRVARAVKNQTKHCKAFESLLAKQFQDHKKSDRVLVRSYQEGSCTNFIVYHEKRVQATLIFKGTRTRPKVTPTVFRPVQQDFIRYDKRTGEVEIEARHEGEEETLRRSFARCFFGDKDFFDGDGAAKCLDLGEIADPAFRLDVPDGVTAAIVHLRFKLAQQLGPSFDIRSKDVLQTLDLNGLRRKLRGNLIQAATIKIGFPDDKRGKRVELSGQNRIRFNRCTHADEVFQLLRDSGLLLSHEVEREEEAAEHAAGIGARSVAHDGRAASAVSRSRTVSKGQATRKLRRGRPR